MCRGCRRQCQREDKDGINGEMKSVFHAVAFNHGWSLMNTDNRDERNRGARILRQLNRKERRERRESRKRFLPLRSLHCNRRNCSQAAMKFSGPRLWSKTQPQRVSGALRLVLRAHSRAPFRLRLRRAAFFAAHSLRRLKAVQPKKA